HELINELMSDFEKFLHDEEIHTPPLIRMGMLHYQFETIHPFLDGNGRMGRLLMTLFLVDKGLMIKPALYLSDFFEHHRTFYYDNLHRVRTHSDMTQWLKFFLAGIIETANSSIQTFKDILKLKERLERDTLPRFKARQKNAIEGLTSLYRTPVTTVKDFMISTGMNYPTANRMINDFEKMGVLKELKMSGGRNRFFLFDEYFDIFLRNPGYRKNRQDDIETK
ncbi:MAG: Fic family protein, partial [Bacteroidota bacterium]